MSKITTRQELIDVLMVQSTYVEPLIQTPLSYLQLVARFLTEVRETGWFDSERLPGFDGSRASFKRWSKETREPAHMVSCSVSKVVHALYEAAIAHEYDGLLFMPLNQTVQCILLGMDCVCGLALTEHDGQTMLIGTPALKNLIGRDVEVPMPV